MHIALHSGGKSYVPPLGGEEGETSRDFRAIEKQRNVCSFRLEVQYRVIRVVYNYSEAETRIYGER